MLSLLCLAQGGSESDASRVSKVGFAHDPLESILLIDFMIDFKFFVSMSLYFHFFFNIVDFHLLLLESHEFEVYFDMDIFPLFIEEL